MPEETTTEKMEKSHLATLVEAGRILNSSLDPAQVIQLALDQVVDFLSAERGFILLIEDGTNQVWAMAGHNIDTHLIQSALSPDSEEPNRAEVSRSIINHVLRYRESIFSVNAMADPRFADRTSVQLSQLRSVMCVPLIAHGRNNGILYMDNRAREGIFDEAHLYILNAFAIQSAIAIENARLYANLRQSMEEKLHLSEELNEQQRERMALQEANRLKSEFVDMVSHELRNPLTTIRGYVQTMLNDNGAIAEDLRKEFYETIEAESDRMLNLINQMLDVSRLESGRALTLNRQPIQIKPLLEKLARSARYSPAWTPKHQLELVCPNDLPDILADGEKLQQILTNLLSNAVKYSPNGGKIQLSAGLNNGSLNLHVKDEGVGIGEEACQKLFNRFERLEREDINNISGTGLGLYLVKQLVDLHGGTVAVSSQINKGSTFSVCLPLSPKETAESSNR